jgi:hypothetical protein
MRTNQQSKLSTGLNLGLFLQLFVLLQCLSWAADKKTEIVIIGTVHAETPSFRVQDLVGILKRVKPDVILFELPADMMTPSYEFKVMLKDSLEQDAVLQYVKETGAKIRPYDIDGRNAFYERINYFAQQSRCSQEVMTAFSTKKMNSEAAKIFRQVLTAYDKNIRIGQSDAAEINSYTSDMTTNERHWLMHQGYAEIVRLTPELKGCEGFFDLDRAYWIRRNNQMTANIRKYSLEFQGQRLVVLCGHEHRYYLRSHLYDWQDDPPNYTVKEFWQY